MDYKEILSLAKPGDFIYMDPPYQGTSHSANSSGNVPNHRYIQGVDFNEFVQELQKLNERGIDFIVSYDEQTGDKKNQQNFTRFSQPDTYLYQRWYICSIYFKWKKRDYL